jgi:hypothetical protein
MERQQIEGRDKQLLLKFRSVVEDKEQKKKKKLRLKLLGALIAFSCGVVMLLMFVSSGEHWMSATVDNRSDTVRLVRPGEEKGLPASKKVPPGERVMETAIAGEAVRAHVPGPAEAFLQPDSRSSALIAIEDIPAAPDLMQAAVYIELKPPVPAKPFAAVPDKVITPKTTKPDLKQRKMRIIEIVACERVENRRYVSPRTQFTLDRESREDVWIWMDVQSSDTPFIINHVYYLNDEKYASVPLTIKYPRMRTWSNITLSHLGQVGDWQVEVVSNAGEVIGQVAFKVVR